MILSKIIIIYLATCLISALTWAYVIICCFEAVTEDMVYTPEDLEEITEGLNNSKSKLLITIFCPIFNIIFVFILLKWKNKLVEDIFNIFTQR